MSVGERIGRERERERISMGEFVPGNEKMHWLRRAWQTPPSYIHTHSSLQTHIQLLHLHFSTISVLSLMSSLISAKAATTSCGFLALPGVTAGMFFLIGGFCVYV